MGIFAYTHITYIHASAELKSFVEKKIESVGFQYVLTKEGTPYDIVFRRVGGLAGKCYINKTCFR